MLSPKDSVGEGVGSPGWILGPVLVVEVSCNVGLTLCTHDGAILGIGDGLADPSTDGPVEDEIKAEYVGAGVGSPGGILGLPLGGDVSCSVGLTLGTFDGAHEGRSDGRVDPSKDGTKEEKTEGLFEGLTLGSIDAVGRGVGSPGAMLGDTLGFIPGCGVSLGLGVDEGIPDGSGNGCKEGTRDSLRDGAPERENDGAIEGLALSYSEISVVGIVDGGVDGMEVTDTGAPTAVTALGLVDSDGLKLGLKLGLDDGISPGCVDGKLLVSGASVASLCTLGEAEFDAAALVDRVGTTLADALTDGGSVLRIKIFVGVVALGAMVGIFLSEALMDGASVVFRRNISVVGADVEVLLDDALKDGASVRMGLVGTVALGAGEGTLAGAFEGRIVEGKTDGYSLNDGAIDGSRVSRSMSMIESYVDSMNPFRDALMKKRCNCHLNSSLVTPVFWRYLPDSISASREFSSAKRYLWTTPSSSNNGFDVGQSTHRTSAIQFVSKYVEFSDGFTAWLLTTAVCKNLW